METNNFRPNLSDTIQDKIICKNCAAKLEFEPGTTSLKCPYCGTVNEIEIKSDNIEELDFESYLQQMENGDIMEEIHTIACEACGAITTLEPNVVSAECPFCGNKLIVKNEKTTKQIKPKSLLPFKVNSKQALESFKSWLKKVWFAPPGFKKYALQEDKLSGVYLPYWTYDSNTITNYKGQRGDDYYETETYTDEDGNTSTHQVSHTRWTKVSGSLKLFFDDVLVLASKSLPHDKTVKLEPWDIENLVPFDEKFLSGFKAESYSVDIKEGFEKAKDRMDTAIREAIKRQIGGDHQQITSMQTKYSDITFKHTLLPIWISAYRFKNKVYRIIINGRTGKVQAERPWCWWKIALVVIAVIALMVAIAYLGGE